MGQRVDFDTVVGLIKSADALGKARTLDVAGVLIVAFAELTADLHRRGAADGRRLAALLQEQAELPEASQTGAATARLLAGQVLARLE